MVVLFVLAAGLAGYLYYLYQNEKSTVSDQEKTISQYDSRLRTPRYNLRVENVNPTAVNPTDKTITVKNDEGDSLVLSVTSTSNIQEVSLTTDKKSRKWTDATLSQVKTTSKVAVLYNGLNEVVSLTFSNEEI